ncbi:MAG: cytochrome C [Deltaproteobacteria bacterium]|nr:cytochrome C [Deltaproteobacteria bacterium]
MKVKKRTNQDRGWIHLIFFILMCFVCGTAAAQQSYVGSDSCMPCHEEEYENFTKYARKSHSFQSVLKMKKGLTSDEFKGCFVCHTTGYGQPGGFVSLEQTPELKDAGCEVCHGPGGQHIESEDPDDLLGKVTIDICQKCHTQERVSAFRYKPMVHGGAH